MSQRYFSLSSCPLGGNASYSRQTKPTNGVSTHCRGGMLPPEYIHKYAFRSVVGRIQCAPTVDENVTYLLA